MSLSQKLVLYALVIALVPLVATGFSVVRISEDTLRSRIAAHQSAAANTVAARIGATLRDIRGRSRDLVNTVAVTLAELSDEERQGLLMLLLRQSPSIASAIFVGPNEQLMAGVSRDEAGQMLPIAEPVAQRMLRSAPARGGDSAPALLGTPYFEREAVGLVVLGLGGPGSRLLLELVLDAELMHAPGLDLGENARVFLVDGSGRVLHHPERSPGTLLQDHPAVRASASELAARVLRFDDAPYLAARSMVEPTRSGTGAEHGAWAVVVEQPLADAFAGPRRMRRQILVWVIGTIIVVLLTAFGFAGRLRAPLQAMVSGARRFGSGHLSEPIELQRGDEMGELADTMNTMAADLSASLAKLERWNHTLEERVETRTAELQEAQAQLLTQSKLAAVGQLGAGVAHEINNPLSVILGFTQMLLARTAADEQTHKTLTSIEGAARRCHQITAGLLRFSERSRSGRSLFAPQGIVEEVAALMGAAFSDAHCALELQLEQVPNILGDAGEIALVLNNVLSNAIEASDEGGRVVVTLATRDSVDGPGIGLWVKDSGSGMSPEALDRVFEPFFTNKTVWTNVGLGLSVCYRVIKAHGGEIDISSTEGEGTEVAIWLPLEAPEGPQEDARQLQNVVQGKLQA